MTDGRPLYSRRDESAEIAAVCMAMDHVAEVTGNIRRFVTDCTSVHQVRECYLAIAKAADDVVRACDALEDAKAGQRRL